MPNKENDFRQFCAKKAFEIAYALFRISGNLERRGFAEHLESQGMNLLAAAAAGERHRVRVALDVIECFMRFGADIGIVNQANSQIVISEANALDSAIAEFGNSATLPNVDLSDIFSNDARGAISGETESQEVSDTTPLQDPAIAEYTTEERRSAIFAKIRQSGNCRIKDVQELLPDTSERTIRYDLQNLIEQGLIERVGSSGPATYYQPKTQQASVNEEESFGSGPTEEDAALA